MDPIGPKVTVYSTQIEESYSNGSFSERDLIQQALFCYRKGCQVDEGADALWELAMLSKEIGNIEEVLFQGISRSIADASM